MTERRLDNYWVPRHAHLERQLIRKNASDQVGGISKEPVDEEGEGEAIDRLIFEVLEDLAGGGETNRRSQ